MTIYNTNPNEGQLDFTLQNLGKTLQSLNNHLENLKTPIQSLNAGDRYLARQEHAARQGDAVFGELAMAGLGSITGFDALEGFTDIGGNFGEALMEAMQELHELDGKNNITALEKTMRLRRQRSYEEELRQERHYERENRRIRNMMTVMAMAVATLEERMKRREKREAKRSTMKAFAQNNQSIGLRKEQAQKPSDTVLSLNANDIGVEAA